MIADGRLEAVDGRVVEAGLQRLLTAGNDDEAEDVARESLDESRSVHPWVAKVENAKADFETLKVKAAAEDFLEVRTAERAPRGASLEDLHRERLGNLRGSVFEELAKGQLHAVQARLWDAVVAYVTEARFGLHDIDHVSDNELVALIKARIVEDVFRPLEQQAAERERQAAEQAAEQRRRETEAYTQSVVGAVRAMAELAAAGQRAAAVQQPAVPQQGAEEGLEAAVRATQRVVDLVTPVRPGEVPRRR